MSALPPKLEQWRQELTETPTSQTASKVISEYFSFFGKEKSHEELWLLTNAALTNDEIHQAQTARDRHDLLFYYEFTKMVLEAVYYLSTEKRSDNSIDS